MNLVLQIPRNLLRQGSPKGNTFQLLRRNVIRGDFQYILRRCLYSAPLFLGDRLYACFKLLSDIGVAFLSLRNLFFRYQRGSFAIGLLFCFGLLLLLWIGIPLSHAQPP